LLDSKLRLAVVADFAEERWPSMDLVADALFDRLRAERAGQVEPVLIRPTFRRRFTRAAAAGEHQGLGHARFNADRLLNRFFDYPRYLRRVRGNFDIFHITDHSYAHLVRHVAHARAIVTCHDLDAFRAVVEPSMTPYPRRLIAGPLRMMAASGMRGLRSAAMVACDSGTTRDDLLRHRLVEAQRTITIPIGVAPAFSAAPDARADAAAALMLGPSEPETLEILHVGSTIARKRIDVLLRTFAAVREVLPTVRLLRVGGPFTADQARLAHKLRVDHATVVLPFVNSEVLAAIYRRAAMVLIPSEREGFGLPLVEAMACGAPVIASDLAVLREVGGGAAEFATVGDVAAWTSLALGLIRECRDDPLRCAARRAEGLEHAANFSWSETARRYVELYRQVVNGDRGL
jgi:glycosyltransferase involved in cell wall biosynthesis